MKYVYIFIVLFELLYEATKLNPFSAPSSVVYSSPSICFTGFFSVKYS